MTNKEHTIYDLTIAHCRIMWVAQSETVSKRQAAELLSIAEQIDIICDDLEMVQASNK